MGSFLNNAITESGRLLLADVQAGAVFIPTKIVIGSGSLPPGKTPATMTAVVSPVKDLTINKRERTPDGKAVFGGVYNNQDITTAFYFRELAMFARAEYRAADGTVTKAVQEVLYSYGNAGATADYMPPYSTNTVVEKQMDVVVWVGNDAVVDLSIESGVYVTRDQLESAIEQAGKVKSVNGKTGDVTLSAADIGAETPTGAQAKADAALAAAKAYAETPTGAQEKANKALADAKKYAESLGGTDGNIVLSSENCTAMGLPAGSTVEDAIRKLAGGILYSDITGQMYTEKRMKIGQAPRHSIVYLKEENRLIPFYVVTHDYESDMNGPGRTALLRKDILEMRLWHNDTTNGYMNSIVNKFLTDDYLPRFPESIRTAIGRTKLTITRGNGSPDTLSIDRPVFLPSLTEYGRSTTSASVEGSDFTQGQPYAIAKYNGVQVKHWTRTPINNTNYGVYFLTETGGISSVASTEPLGLRPMFTMPKDFEVVWYEDAAGNAYESQLNGRVVKLTDMLGKLITIPNSQVQSIAVGKAEVLE